MSATTAADGQELAGRRVLITGASGFIGGHLASALTNAGVEVHAIRRRDGGSTLMPLDGVVWHEAELTERQTLQDAVARSSPDVVFHLAAYGAVARESDPERVLQVNVHGTWNLWQALGDRSARVVYTGSCGEYGATDHPVSETDPCEPTWFYPATKHAAGTLLATLGREQKRDVVIVRPFNPYGPADRPARFIPHVVATLLSGDEVRVTAGEQQRDFLFVSDLVRALVRAAVCPVPTGSIYNIGSGRASTLRDVIATIADLVGDRAIDRVRFGALPYRADEVWHLSADITRARRDLGFEPRVTLEDGLAQTIAWYRARVQSSVSSS